MSSRQPALRTATAAGARRNLFHNSLARRPPAPGSASAGSATTLLLAGADAGADFVARDEHGNYQLERLPAQPMPKDAAAEEREIENRLIESYRSGQHHLEPGEMKAALLASLRAKAASLEEDRWMFEREDGVPS